MIKVKYFEDFLRLQHFNYIFRSFDYFLKTLMYNYFINPLGLRITQTVKPKKQSKLNRNDG